MQYANIMLALGGDRGTTVPKAEVSASEIAVLRLIHGAEAVFDVEPVEIDEDDERANISDREEIRRLAEIYGKARVDTADGIQVSVITALFPGAGAKAVTDLKDLDIPDEFYKPKSRASADDVDTGKKAKTSKSKAKAKAEDKQGADNDGEGAKDEVFE